MWSIIIKHQANIHDELYCRKRKQRKKEWVQWGYEQIWWEEGKTKEKKCFLVLVPPPSLHCYRSLDRARSAWQMTPSWSIPNIPTPPTIWKTWNKDLWSSLTLQVSTILYRIKLTTAIGVVEYPRSVLLCVQDIFLTHCSWLERIPWNNIIIIIWLWMRQWGIWMKVWSINGCIPVP